MATCEQLVYTIFIGNNHTLFRVWRKENLVKHLKVSKYYDPDFLSYFTAVSLNTVNTESLNTTEIFAELQKQNLGLNLEN